MSRWVEKNLSSNILYSFIIILFTTGICIDFAMKQNQSFDKFSIFFSSLLATMGFILLLTHHFLNTKWLYGFVIEKMMCQ